MCTITILLVIVCVCERAKESRFKNGTLEEPHLDDPSARALSSMIWQQQEKIGKEENQTKEKEQGETKIEAKMIQVKHMTRFFFGCFSFLLKI